MKITLNDEEVLTLSELQKKVIKDEIQDNLFENDMKRRLQWVIEHPCFQYIEENAERYNILLKSKNVTSKPLNPFELAKKVFEYEDVPLSDEEKKTHMVKVDGKDLFEITIEHKKLLKLQEFGVFYVVEWCKGRLKWILQHKY